MTHEDRQYEPPRKVFGRCPACHNATLFLADSGHVTCSWIDCKNPGAAGVILDGVQEVERVEQFVANLDALVRMFTKASGDISVSDPATYLARLGDRGSAEAP